MSIAFNSPLNNKLRKKAGCCQNATPGLLFGKSLAIL